MFGLNAQGVFVLGILMAVMWLLQFALAYRQMRRFYTRLKFLRKGGLTAIGMNGNRLRGRAYAVLVVDAAERIISADGMSGYTIFASLKPYPALIGMALADLQATTTTLPVPAALRPAFAHAARSIAEGRQPNAAVVVGEATLINA